LRRWEFGEIGAGFNDRAITAHRAGVQQRDDDELVIGLEDPAAERGEVVGQRPGLPPSAEATVPVVEGELTRPGLRPGTDPLRGGVRHHLEWDPLAPEAGQATRKMEEWNAKWQAESERRQKEAEARRIEDENQRRLAEQLARETREAEARAQAFAAFQSQLLGSSANADTPEMLAHGEAGTGGRKGVSRTHLKFDPVLQPFLSCIFSGDFDHDL
jgi:hypothetical protein